MRVSAIASLLSSARLSVEEGPSDEPFTPLAPADSGRGLVPAVHGFSRRPATPSGPAVRGAAASNEGARPPRAALSAASTSQKALSYESMNHVAIRRPAGVGSDMSSGFSPGSSRPTSSLSITSDASDRLAGPAFASASQERVTPEPRSTLSPSSSPFTHEEAGPVASVRRSSAVRSVSSDHITMTCDHLNGTCSRMDGCFDRLHALVTASGTPLTDASFEAGIAECAASVDEFVAAVAVAERVAMKDGTSGLLSAALSGAQASHGHSCVQLLGCIHRLTPRDGENSGSITSLARLCSLSFQLHAHPLLVQGSGPTERADLSCLLSAAKVVYLLAQSADNDNLLKSSHTLSHSSEFIRSLQMQGMDGCAVSESRDSPVFSVTSSVALATWMSSNVKTSSQLLEALSFLVGAWKQLVVSKDMASYFVSQGCVPAAAALAAAVSTAVGVQLLSDTPPELLKAVGTHEKALMQLNTQLMGLFRQLANQSFSWNAVIRAHVPLIAIGSLSVSKIVKYTEYVELSVRIACKACQRPEILNRMSHIICLAPNNAASPGTSSARTATPSALATRTMLQQIMYTIAAKKSHTAILSRLLFMLGCATGEETSTTARKAVSAGADSSDGFAGAHMLLSLLQRASSQLLANSTAPEFRGSSTEVEDLCCKLLRVLANACAEPDACVAVSAHPACSVVGPLLDAACTASSGTDNEVATRNELLLTCLSFITNISYGCDTVQAETCCVEALKKLSVMPPTTFSVSTLHTLCPPDSGFASCVPFVIFCLASVFTETSKQYVASLQGLQVIEAASSTMKGVALECLRALSNLMRSSAARTCLHSSLSLFQDDGSSGMVSFLRALCTLLHSTTAEWDRINTADMDVAFTAVGLLMNLAREPCWKISLRLPLEGIAGTNNHTTTVGALIFWLKQHWENDHANRTALLTVCLQALCNFARGWRVDAEDEIYRFDDEQAVDLLQTASVILDEIPEEVEEAQLTSMADAAGELQETLQGMVEDGAVNVSDE
jgi:hypothetical protein